MYIITSNKLGIRATSGIYITYGVAGGAWTASGVKVVQGQFCYEI